MIAFNTKSLTFIDTLLKFKPMRKFFIVCIALSSIAACGPSRKNSQTNTATSVSVNDNANDGSSFEKAIVIQEKSEKAGVAAEYKWVRDNYPDSKVQSQALQMNKGKSYDVLNVALKDGSNRKFYFDISNFFGKY